MAQLTFEQWLARVNAEVQKRLDGMGIDDISDWSYRDAYDDDMTPVQAAREAIRESMFG